MSVTVRIPTPLRRVTSGQDKVSVDGATLNEVVESLEAQQGNETPTIQQGDVDFSQLGVQMRGFHDFGMNKQEKREGVKSVGA